MRNQEGTNCPVHQPSTHELGDQKPTERQSPAPEFYKGGWEVIFQNSARSIYRRNTDQGWVYEEVDFSQLRLEDTTRAALELFFYFGLSQDNNPSENSGPHSLQVLVNKLTKAPTAIQQEQPLEPWQLITVLEKITAGNEKPFNLIIRSLIPNYLNVICNQPGTFFELLGVSKKLSSENFILLCELITCNHLHAHTVLHGLARGLITQIAAIEPHTASCLFGGEKYEYGLWFTLKPSSYSKVEKYLQTMLLLGNQIKLITTHSELSSADKENIVNALAGELATGVTMLTTFHHTKNVSDFTSTRVLDPLVLKQQSLVLQSNEIAVQSPSNIIGFSHPTYVYSFPTGENITITGIGTKCPHPYAFAQKIDHPTPPPAAESDCPY